MVEAIINNEGITISNGAITIVKGDKTSTELIQSPDCIIARVKEGEKHGRAISRYAR